MKKVSKEDMKRISNILYPELSYDKALAKMRSEYLFVPMRNGKTYVIMDKIYSLIK